MSTGKTKQIWRLKRRALGLCSICDSTPVTSYRYKTCTKCRSDRAIRYAKYKSLINEKRNTQQRNLHQIALMYYSNGTMRCACTNCPETNSNFLTIDHINNDGYEHRKLAGPNIAQWLRRNDYPEGFQVLCMNCNWGKKFTGICPHME
jgi:hypothetical protein